MTVMKLAFSTLGCPEWTLEQVIDRAAEYGYQGVELRGLQGEFDLPHHPEFASAHRAEVKKRFQAQHLEVVCISTSCDLIALTEAEQKKSRAEVESNLQLAADLGSKYIRVFGGRRPEGKTEAEHIDIVAQNLAQITRSAEKYNVSILVETHDDLSRGQLLGKILDRVNHKYAGAVWDINHPYRQGEKIEDTMAYLGKYVRHMHFKNTKRLANGSARCVLMGQGDLPIEEILHLLKQNNYSGYLSLEWEKAWRPDIAEPEIAFPDFVQKMIQLHKDE